MKVTIYGTPTCTYCNQAKALCNRFNYEYEYIDILTDPQIKKDLEALVGSEVRTVPQIVVDGKHVGGFNDFKTFIQKL